MFRTTKESFSGGNWLSYELAKWSGNLLRFSDPCSYSHLRQAPHGRSGHAEQIIFKGMFSDWHRWFCSQAFFLQPSSLALDSHSVLQCSTVFYSSTAKWQSLEQNPTPKKQGKTIWLHFLASRISSQNKCLPAAENIELRQRGKNHICKDESKMNQRWIKDEWAPNSSKPFPLFAHFPCRNGWGPSQILKVGSILVHWNDCIGMHWGHQFT